jgi:acetyltransferase
MPRGGGVAVISQSGAIAEEIIGSSHSLAIPIGAIVSVGNAMQLGLAEYLEHFGADPACRAILLYVESFGDAPRFQALAQRISAHKPIVALIGGRTGPGREAAFRHTGSRAMTDAQGDAFCADSGMIRVRSLRALMLAAKALGLHPRGIGTRVLLLSNSGGPGVLAADRCAELGLELPELPAALATRLRALYPPEAVVANPLDLLADAREDRFGDTLEAVLQMAWDRFDAICMIHVVPFMVDADAVVTRLAALAKGAPLPILHAMMGTLEGRQAWMARMEAAGVPMFDNVEDMAEAAGLLARYRSERKA